jgi:uncharacterized membrane protein YgcG
LRTGSFDSFDNRTSLIRLALLLALLATGMLAVGPTASATDEIQTQNTPAPRPDDVPTLYNATDLFTKDQLGTLLMDAYRLESIKIPTVFYVRVADSDYAGPASTRQFADTIRADWDIESAPGADNGLVILLTLDKQGEHGHSLTLSYGEATFARSGLTPGYIQEVFDERMMPLLEEGRYFDAVSGGMRRIRYGGIYFAPPVPPLVGAAQTVHTGLAWLAPLGVIAISVLFITLSLRLPMDDPARRPLVRRIAVATGGLALVLFALSVYGRSAIGVASAMLITLALAIQLWIWTRPRSVPRRSVRARAVPLASRRVRRLQRARRLALGAAGEGQR